MASVVKLASAVVEPIAPCRVVKLALLRFRSKPPLIVFPKVKLPPDSVTALVKVTASPKL